MKKILKKNQVILLATALMLVTAGYFSYTTSHPEVFGKVASLMDSQEVASIGDAKLVNSNVVEENTKEENIIQDKTEDTQTKEENIIKEEERPINTNAVLTSSNNENNYYSESRIQRDTMYSQMLDTYQKILENEAIPNDQKTVAQNEIKSINDRKNALMICENLIKTKGFSDVIIFCNDNSINIVVKKERLETEEVAQIQNIVSREMNTQIEDIHISTKI